MGKEQWRRRTPQEALSAHSKIGYAEAKQALQRASGLSRQSQTCESENATEGSYAFTEKREPLWVER